jgi:transcriptional pleiotropic repressor
LSYKELSEILCQLIDANVLIFDIEGRVLGSAYNNIEDKSTIGDSDTTEKIVDYDNAQFLSIEACTANLYGDEMKTLLGEEYAMAEKYHTIVPSICGGKRLGTLLLTRRDKRFDDEDLALCEYGATVVGLEIQRKNALKKAHEDQLRMTVDMAIGTLSYSERDAVGRILGELEEEGGLIVASRIAQAYELTNSVIVNALRKLESAGVLEAKSLGMKGTRIKILNPYLKEAVEKLSK